MSDVAMQDKIIKGSVFNQEIQFKERANKSILLNHDTKLIDHYLSKNYLGEKYNEKGEKKPG